MVRKIITGPMHYQRVKNEEKGKDKNKHCKISETREKEEEYHV